jgi:hypothetical protein
MHLAAASAPLRLTVAQYARMAVADFARLADDEAWASLLSRLRDHPDPGAVCLAEMVRWRMSAQRCSATAAPPAPEQEGDRHGEAARTAG